MEKSREKLLLLSYLIWAVVPFLPYVDPYRTLKVKFYPIQGNIDMIVEVEFHFNNWFF